MSCILAEHVYGEWDAAPLLLLHGFGADSSWWARAITELAKVHRIYVLDLCFRDSLDQMAQAILHWMHQRCLEHLSVAAHSLASPIALRMADGAPERITRLILVNPCVCQREVTVWQWIQRCRQARKISTDPPEQGFQWKHIHPSTWRVVRNALREPMRAVHIDQIPTLILWGTKDPIFPVVYAPDYQRLLPFAQLVLIEAGHSLMYEQPAFFQTFVLSFPSEQVRAQDSAKKCRYLSERT